MDDEERDVTPQESKCWTCKHGFCLQEKDIQSFFQPGLVDGNPFENRPDQPGMTEVTFPISKIRSICFWRPAHINQMVAPVVFNQIMECSRYEKQD